MPRNGSGTYSLPASSWNPAVTGTTIESSAANTTLTDLASALTQSLSKDGQTVPTGNLPMGGFKLTGLADGAAATDSMAYGQGAKLTGGNTFTGDQTINGSVSLSGSLTVSGPVIFSSGTITVDNLTVSSVASIASLNVTGNAVLNTLTVSSSLVVGAASGGGKGAGTINSASTIYVNGAAVAHPYEAGSFTPALKFGGAAVGMTTSSASGAYTRVGNTVKFSILIILTAKGSSTGAATITGLPVTASGISQPVPVWGANLTGLTGALSAMALGAGTSLGLYQSSATGPAAITDAVFGNTTQINISGVYEIT